MPRSTTALLFLLAAGCSAKPAPAGAALASATAGAAPAAPSAPVSASAAPSASAEPDADPADSSDAPPKSRYDCGAKGQKYCPMQGWMKRVMGPASANRDGPKMVAALEYVAKRPPPGLSGWTKMAREGAAKARRGDIDGAKGSCRTCHEAHKRAYRETMRDRAW